VSVKLIETDPLAIKYKSVAISFIKLSYLTLLSLSK